MERYTWAESPSDSGFPIARPGYPFIGISAFVTAIFALTGLHCLTIIGLAFTLFCCYFFRDPDRVTPAAPDALIAPADGKVIVAEKVDSHPYGDGPAFQISIFMSVFNVHVNRIPFDGIIRDLRYQPGRFFNASLDKASTDNERSALLIETESGKKFWNVQVAGLVARRIICRVQPGDTVQKGRRYGMICFGSRLDLFLPPEFASEIKIGQRTQSGTTILGYLK